MKEEKKLLSRLTKILTAGFILSLASHIFLGRGLDLDGVHILYEMILEESFIYYETARITTHFFQQLPTWLFIKFIPINSPSILIQVFSFGLVWIHIISIIGCYLILPVDKKYFLFFPLFGFFTGPLTALGISISASLSVSSYIWLIIFIIHYSNLSYKLHYIVFLLAPLPLFFSHEMLFYMSWPLIFLIMEKKKSGAFYNKMTSYYLINFLAFCSILSLLFILFPVKSEISNRADFFKSLLSLEFFFKFKQGKLENIFFPSLTAFCLLVSPFLYLLKQKSSFASAALLMLILLFGLSSSILPFYNFPPLLKFSAEEEARVFVSCISHPISILFWRFFEKKKLKINPSFFSICLIASSLLLVYRIGSDYKFYQFQKQFSSLLEDSRGIISWEEFSEKKDFQNKADPLLFELFNFSWKYLSSSLLYPRQNKVKSLILSNQRFQGCYQIPQYGMCENKPILKNNKFFNFDELIKYQKNKISSP